MTSPATSWSQKTWFITGASSGFGAALSEEVLSRGGRVVMTARAPDTLAGLVSRAKGKAISLRLDVTKPTEIEAAVEAAEAFGGIDVLVNNAGYGFLGGVEESAEAEVQTQLNVNFHGPMRIMRAALPFMRARGAGFIVNMSSLAAVCGFAGGGYYSASKFALEGLTEALGAEVKPFGIRTMLVEPGPFKTHFRQSIVATKTPHPDYPALEQQRAFFRDNESNQAGDPIRAAQAIIMAMESETPPQRLVLGASAHELAVKVLRSRLAETEAWRFAALGADRDEG